MSPNPSHTGNRCPVCGVALTWIDRAVCAPCITASIRRNEPIDAAQQGEPERDDSYDRIQAEADTR